MKRHIKGWHAFPIIVVALFLAGFLIVQGALPPPPPCPSGTTGTPPNCVPIPPPECPVGTVGTRPECFTVCGNKKLEVCHIPPGNEGNPQTICISENALPAHMAHGDAASCE